MATQKITCPVCFTKMNMVGHDMVCPECGYKYCEDRIPYTYDDHNHNEYKSYNTKTSYSNGYASSSQGTSSSSQYSAPAQRAASGSQYSSGSPYTAPAQRAASTSQYSSASQGTSSTSQYSAQARSTSSTGQQTAVQSSYAANQRYSAAQKKQYAKKASSIRLIFFIVITIIIVQIFRNTFAGLNIDKNDIQDSIDKFMEAFYSAVEKNNSKSSSSDDEYKSAPDGDSTAEDVIAYFKSLKQPQTLFEDLLCHISSKSINKITLDDCQRISEMIIYRDEGQGRLCVYYRLTDDTVEYYYPDVDLIDSAELRVFRNLEQFRAVGIVNMFLESGDLTGLTLLNDLECSNTPKSLAKLIEDPGQLMYLTLNSSELSFDLSGLEEFENLYALDLYSPIGIEGENSIAALKNLTNLSIYVTTKPQDYSFLESLENLIFLNIRAVHFRDLSFLRSLPNLSSLEICDSESLEDLSPIGDCRQLVELSLCSLGSVTDFSPLTGLSDLEYLRIDNCRMDNVLWLTPLERLCYLDIKNNYVTDLSPLAELKSLQELHVDGNPVFEYGNLDRSIIIEDAE